VVKNSNVTLTKKNAKYQLLRIYSIIIKTMAQCLMKLLEMDDSAFMGAPPPSKQRERLEGKISCLGVTMVTLFRVRVMTPCTENG